MRGLTICGSGSVCGMQLLMEVALECSSLLENVDEFLDLFVRVDDTS